MVGFYIVISDVPKKKRYRLNAPTALTNAFKMVMELKISVIRLHDCSFRKSPVLE